MAVTFTPTTRKVYASADRKELIVDIACTGTPTVGGDTLTAAVLGLDDLDAVVPCGAASNVGGTSGANVAVIHGAGGGLASVKIVFLVQGTAGAANGQIAYTGATANFAFRARILGRGKVATAP